MSSQREVQEFNEKNSIYQVLFNYIQKWGIPFEERDSSELSKKTVKKFIDLKGIVINGSLVRSSTQKISDGDVVEIPELKISFVCRANHAHGDVEETDQLNIFVADYLSKHLGCSTVREIAPGDYKKAFSYLLMLYEIKDFEELKSASQSHELVAFLKDKLSDSNIPREANIPKQTLATSGKLIDALLIVKAETQQKLVQLIDGLVNGHYNDKPFKFLDGYSKILNTSSYQYLIQPLLDSSLATRMAIENLIKPIIEARVAEGTEAKIHFFEGKKSVYESYRAAAIEGDALSASLFLPIAEHLFDLLKIACEASIEKSALLTVSPTSKKYNFENTEQDVFLIIKNTGEGIAKNVRIATRSDVFGFVTQQVGMLKPQEAREITVGIKICDANAARTEMDLILYWDDISGNAEEQECTVIFELQDANIPWADLKKQNPYSIQIISDRSKLYGRDDILDELRSNILSNNIESYKVWGQKRVGKSSIVKTLQSILVDREDVIVVYRRIGGLRNPDPIKTLNDLGEALYSEILTEIDSKVKSPLLREHLKTISIPTFDGSLYQLEVFLSKLHRADKSLKFVFILDEFDRINDEFFMPGTLGEALSQCIGKGLNEEPYVGFILVGSENMQILDRQGMNYNSYREREVDTFDKQREYAAFKKIVTGPVAPHVTYSEDAIDRIFEVSNGNPYFTNLICYNAFNAAHKNQDAYIDTHAIESGINLIVRSSQKSHFEHFWGDGLHEEGDVKRERKTDIRRRVLVSFSMSMHLNANQYPTRKDILKNFKYPSEYVVEPYEVEYTINEFFTRKIFFDPHHSVRIKPELFEKWLIGPGRTLMIEGVSDLEALHRERELEEQYALKTEELERLKDQYIFKGEKLSIEAYRSFFKQFGSSSSQRRIFKIVDSIYFLSQADVQDFFRNEQKNIFPKQEVVAREGAKSVYRSGVDIYARNKSLLEYAPIIDTFKVMSRIHPQRVARRLVEDAKAWSKNESTEVVIIEPLIDDSSLILQEIETFLKEVKDQALTVRLVTLVITSKAKTRIIKATSGAPNFKLILCREIEETKIKPFISGTEILETADEANLVYAEVKKIFPLTRRDTMLVLFESVCSDLSCPILWHTTETFTPLFPNSFGKLEATEDRRAAEHRRTRIYHANTELSQALNKYLIGHLREKAKKEGKTEWFTPEYIPKIVLDHVFTRWTEEKDAAPKETYFDFIHYKQIIKLHHELHPIFFIGSNKQLDWLDKLNNLRRDPAHPEKEPPTEEEVQYFESTASHILSKIR